jgi:hypothetical protein
MEALSFGGLGDGEEAALHCVFFLVEPGDFLSAILRDKPHLVCSKDARNKSFAPQWLWAVRGGFVAGQSFGVRRLLYTPSCGIGKKKENNRLSQSNDGLSGRELMERRASQTPVVTKRSC